MKNVKNIHPRIIGFRRDGRPIYSIAGGAPTLEELRQACEAGPSVATLTNLRGAIAARLKAINEEAGDADLADDKAEEWRQLEQEHTSLGEKLEAEERSQRLRESRKKFGAPQVMQQVPTDDVDARSLTRPEARDRGLKLLDSRDLAGHLEERQKVHVERVMREQSRNTDGAFIARMMLLTSTDAYRSAFAKIASSTQPILTPEESRAVEAVRELRAASLTDASGGFAVPVLIDPTIILTGQGSPNDVLRLANVKTITTDEWKGVSSAGVTWKFDAEAAASTDNAPTLAQPNVITRRADGFIPYSIEIGQDWPSFAAEMGMLLSEGYSEILAEKLTTGVAASNEPIGIVTALDANTNVEIETTTAGAIQAADLYRLWDALPARYRRAAKVAWMSSTDAQNDIRQLGTVDPNFTVNLGEAGIARLFGREYPTNDYMADVPAGTGTQPLMVVGDWNNYVVAQRAGMSVELVPHLFDVTNNRPTGQRGLFAWARVGADSVNDLGFRLLVNNDGA